MGYKQLALVLDRLKKLIVRRGVTSVTVHQREGTRVLNLRDIAYVEVFNHSLVFHTADAAHEANGSLSEYESDNRFASFVKVSKSHLVNCAYITEIGDDFVTVAGDKLPLTRRRKKECLEKIAKANGRESLEYKHAAAVYKRYVEVNAQKDLIREFGGNLANIGFWKH
jgi:DNA-binding LytR/AlgR family response regulator